MCTAGLSDLEEIPLDDDDSRSVEFQILAYYVKHHVFKDHSSLFSPKRPRTRSLSQKGLGSWTVSDAWPTLPWASRQSSPGEQTINLTKKKSSWRTIFSVTEKEEFPSQSNQNPPVDRCQAGPPGYQWTRSLSNVEQHMELKETEIKTRPLDTRTPVFPLKFGGAPTRAPSQAGWTESPGQAVDPKVIAVAQRVAEIVNSWPPPEEFVSQGGGVKGNLVPYLQFQGASTPAGPNSAKQGGEDLVITRIIELLKYSGDRLDRELKRDRSLMSSFQDGLSYALFKTITDQFLQGVDTRGESELKAQSFRAALAIDVMTKLTALDTHPMNRVLGFGAKYLKEHFSPWVQQHGGWEKVFGVAQEEVD